MKNKWVKASLALILSMTLIAAPVAQASSIAIIVNGQAASTDVDPIIVGGTVLVPVKFIASALGSAVTWDSKTQTLTAVKGESTGSLVIGSKTATVTTKGTKKEVSLSQPAMLVHNRVMVSLRFLFEFYGAKVSWNGETDTVTVTTISEDTTATSGEKGDRGDTGAASPAGSTG